MIRLTKGDATAELAAPTRMPSVNLLPPELVVARRFRVVQAGLGGAVLAAAAVVGLLYLSAGGDVSQAQEQVNAANAQTSSLQSQVARYREVTATYQQVAAAQALLSAAMSTEVRYSGFLNDLSLSIPSNVWVTNVVYTQNTPGTAAAASTGSLLPTGLGTLTVTGVAYSHDDVAVWLEALSREKGYGLSVLTNSTAAVTGSKTLVTWSTTTTLTNDALSGRYAQAGS